MIKILIIAGFALVLFLFQSLGTWLQIKDYQKAIKRAHKHGNVGMGQKRGMLSLGYLCVIACDSNGIITYGEHLRGLTIFNKCRPFTKLAGKDMVGKHIDEYLDDFRAMEKGEYNKYKGYAQALDALERLLYPERFDEDELHKRSLNPDLNRRKSDLEAKQED